MVEQHCPKVKLSSLAWFVQSFLYFGASLSTTNGQPKYWNMGKASKERGTQTETQKQTHTHTHTHKIIPEAIENTFRKRKQ